MRYVNNIKTMNEAFANGAAQGNVTEVVHFPLEVTLTMSLACNYRCTMCFQDRYDLTLRWQAIERLAPILPFARTLQLFGGEPMLYKHIKPLYEMAHANGCLVTMISNGSLLTEEMVESIVENQVHCIKFSIDAGSPATYKKIRGGDYFNVLRGVARIARRKMETRSFFPVYDFNFLAMRSNVKELSRLVVTAAELGVRAVNVFYPNMLKDHLVEDCVYFDQERSDDMLSRAREVARHLGVGLNLPPLFGEYEAQAATISRERCLDPWTKAFVNADGTVNLCCGGDTRIGSLYESEFEEIWNGERAKRLRATVNTPDEPAFCKRCRIRKVNPHNPEMHIPRELWRKHGITPRNQPCEA
ncbi:radical SAM protein [Fundidesulfovibrio butyratiphilus]